MPRVPDKFSTKYDKKGEKFYEIAELLYKQPERQFTQDELAEQIGRSNSTISSHIRDMEDEGWITRREDQITFSWDTNAHNPASTEGVTAIRRFYVDFWDLLKKHSETTPGTFAIIGFFFILAAGVIFAFFFGFSFGVVQGSTVPPEIYAGIAFGSFITGIIVTFLSPLQAVVNRFLLNHIPERFYTKE